MGRPRKPNKPTQAEYQARYRQRLDQRLNNQAAQSMAARDLAMRMKEFSGETIVLHIPQATPDATEFLWSLIAAVQELQTERAYIRNMEIVDRSQEAKRRLTSRFANQTDLLAIDLSLSSGPTEDAWKDQEAANRQAARDKRNQRDRDRRAAKKST